MYSPNMVHNGSIMVVEKANADRRTDGQTDVKGFHSTFNCMYAKTHQNTNGQSLELLNLPKLSLSLLSRRPFVYDLNVLLIL